MGLHTLKSKKDIERVFSFGSTVSDRILQLKIVPNTCSHMRVVLCVPKRLRYKNKKMNKPLKNTQVRRMRALINAEYQITQQSFDVALIVKCANTPFCVLRKSFVFLMNRFIQNNKENLLTTYE